MYNIIPITDEENKLWYRSEMNNRQFMALSHRLLNSDIENEILNNNYFLNKVSLSATYFNMDVVQWLKNSWNTESVLFQNKDIIKNTNQSFCMQWAFPQAYYAIFGNILAMFKTIGFTETSHSAVLKKYALIMSEGKLPDSISLCCEGIDGEFVFNNIVAPDDIDGHMSLSLNEPQTIDNQICQFLGATRRLRLREKAPHMNFRTKSGTKRKRLHRELWLKISNNIGPTTIVDFLYRKRIKGNYQDIETYSCPYFKGGQVLDNLIAIIDRLNLVTETYVAKAMGLDEYSLIVENQLSKVENDSLGNRFSTSKNIIEVCG